MTLIVRTAKFSDSQFFYDLRGFKGYQQYFLSEFTIDFSDHDRWFRARCDAPLNLLYVASVSACDVGYVRFEPVSTFVGFEISFAIAPMQLGKGYSSEMILKSLHALRSSIPGSENICVIANVFENNHPSKKALVNSGFLRISNVCNMLLHHLSSNNPSTYRMESYIILL
jgi:hypothetical protein